MKLKLYRVILPVNDIDKAEDFYSVLFGMKGMRVSEGRHYFDLGGIILACYDPIADGDELGDGWRFHENQYIYIAVDDLDAMFLKVKKAGVTILADIKEMPWGEKLFYCRDPFENPICFVDENTLFTGE